MPPEINDIAWPPSRDEWLRYLAEAREKTASYKRFQGVVGNVCEVTKRYWYHKLGVPEDDLDPRHLYRADHYRMMHVIKREHGLGVKQIAPITMHEARNATHFADAHSIRGVAACAAFSVGTLLGGRRPRTLTAILLEDLYLYAGLVKIDSQEVVVPCMRVKFRQEKFDDKQGPREATDEPHYDGILSSYSAEFWISCAFWVYRLLVLRGVFVVFDPILTAKEGDVLHISSDCLQYYLFCDVQPNYWIDTAPTSVGTIGSWNKLFDTLVLPILSFGCKVWGVDTKCGAAAEALHRDFLRRLLGVRKSTANHMVLAELGRFPLQVHFWQRFCVSITGQLH